MATAGRGAPAEGGEAPARGSRLRGVPGYVVGTLNPIFESQRGLWDVFVDLDAATLWSREKAGIEDTWVAMANYQRWCLLRRIYSRRQVLETDPYGNFTRGPGGFPQIVTAPVAWMR